MSNMAKTNNMNQIDPKNSIKITEEDLQKILTLPVIPDGDPGFSSLKEILTNCFCRCAPNNVTTIIDYEIFLNDLNDIILRGKCKNCEGPVGRYVETGEVTEYEDVIEEVRRKYEAN